MPLLRSSDGSFNIQVPAGQLNAEWFDSNSAIPPTSMAQRAFALVSLPVTDARVWDNMASLLPGTAAADDCEITTGTPGTDAPRITAGDVAGAGSSTRKFAFAFALPPNYESGESVRITVRAYVAGAACDTSCTIDCEVFKCDGDGAVGSDLITASAGDMNSTSPADFDFDVTSSGLVAGDLLVAVFSIAYNDAATVSGVTPSASSVIVKADTKG